MRKTDMDASECADDKIQLIDAVTKAFDSVVLGNGVGLYQGQAIDDYKTKFEEQTVRLSDEKNDWRLISVDDLNKCNSSLSFFDAEGMRFHLPTYLIADLKGEYNFGMEFCLTHLSDYSKAQFALFNAEQRGVIRDVLNFWFNEAPESFFSVDILNAVLGFWSEEND